MPKSIEEEVQDVLSQTADKVVFEEPLAPESSPLNQPVVENEIGHSKPTPDKKEEIKPVEEHSNTTEKENTPESSLVDQETLNFQPNKTDNVPEQEIGSGEYNEQLQEELADDEGMNFELPSNHAKQAADTILGMTDNIMAVGGGFFIKIKKHKEFYDFEEVIQVIDEQNEKNILKLQLDEGDKILLRPLLISMLKRKAKKLTPEQQLLGAVLSILMKKAQVVMGMKAENEILVDRILDVIREEKGYSDQDDDVDEEQETPINTEIITEEKQEEEVPNLNSTIMEVVQEGDDSQEEAHDS